MNEKLNLTFNIPREQLEDKINFKLSGREGSDYNNIIPLKAISAIDELTFIKKEMLTALIRNIPLKDTTDKPYEHATVEQYCIEPNFLSIGQTFILEQKVLSLTKISREIFSTYCAPGLPKMPPVIIYGRHHNGTKALAIYIPPLIEHHHDDDILLDGIHRAYIAKSASTNIAAVRISNICTPPPFDPLCWKDAQLVTTKPPIEQRYKNLHPSLYRDLSVVGIDG